MACSVFECIWLSIDIENARRQPRAASTPTGHVVSSHPVWCLSNPKDHKGAGLFNADRQPYTFEDTTCPVEGEAGEGGGASGGGEQRVPYTRTSRAVALAVAPALGHGQGPASSNV